MTQDTTRLRVDSDAEGERVDRWVAERLDVPRSRIQRWLRDGRVLVAGEPVRPSTRLVAGQAVTVARPPAADLRVLEPDPTPLDLVWEDEDLLVVDKPAGLVVHPGAGVRDRTLVHRLVAHDPGLAIVGSPERPGIVHRLDRDTTGALAVARTDRAYRLLSKAFAERRVDKRYLAIVWGRPDPPEGSIDAPLERHPSQRVLRAVRPGGRAALTDYRVEATAGPVSLLSLRLHTGRTHQIRVHLQHLRHPIVGDPAYGERRYKNLPGAERAAYRDFPRPALHAWRLGLPHPAGGRLETEVRLHDDMVELWEHAAHAPPPLGSSPNAVRRTRSQSQEGEGADGSRATDR